MSFTMQRNWNNTDVVNLIFGLGSDVCIKPFYRKNHSKNSNSPLRTEELRRQAPLLIFQLSRNPL